MRKLKIKRVDIELAFELNSYETTAYLDTETGEVVFVENDAVDQLETLLTGDEIPEDTAVGFSRRVLITRAAEEATNTRGTHG